MQQSFAVYAADGTKLRVITIQHMIDATSMDGPGVVPGLRELRLEDGRAVNYLDENTFQIVATGEIVRRTRPK